MVFLSQGVPMLLSGDEFGNSQGGNNNAYCQDNEVGWLNWKQSVAGKELYEFTRQLIQFRKEHPHFHASWKFKCIDYLSCGYPDFSIHGTKAWYPDYSNYSRCVGMLFGGEYFKSESYYVIFNMYWENQEFGLPDTANDKAWKLVMASDEKLTKETAVETRKFCMPARSVAVFVSCEEIGRAHV